MVPVIVIRPEPGCAATVSAAQALRMEAHGFALFRIAARSWHVPAASDFDAILLGSANALRLAGPGLAGLTSLPVYAVGETTAAAAQAAGFGIAATGSGGLQAVLGGLAPTHRRLLRLGGDERVPLTLPSGISLEERVVYASEPLPLPPPAVAVLRDPAIIVVHSALAASHFAAQCVAHGISRARQRLAVLAPRILQAAGDGWGEVAVAGQPSDVAVLALARQMCLDPWPGTRPGL